MKSSRYLPLWSLGSLLAVAPIHAQTPFKQPRKPKLFQPIQHATGYHPAIIAAQAKRARKCAKRLRERVA